MNFDDAKRCFGRLVSLYPQWRARMNQEQVDTWTNSFAPFMADDVFRAIDQHYRDPKHSQRPNLGALLALLQNKRIDPGAAASFRSEKFSDILRRQGVGDAAMPDHAIICEFYRRWWMKLSAKNTRDVSPGYRRQLRSQCTHSLMAEGASQEEADHLAETIYDAADIYT